LLSFAVTIKVPPCIIKMHFLEQVDVSSTPFRQRSHATPSTG
jgi:hypothetical protein